MNITFEEIHGFRIVPSRVGPLYVITCDATASFAGLRGRVTVHTASKSPVSDRDLMPLIVGRTFVVGDASARNIEYLKLCRSPVPNAGTVLDESGRIRIIGTVAEHLFTGEGSIISTGRMNISLGASKLRAGKFVLELDTQIEFVTDRLEFWLGLIGEETKGETKGGENKGADKGDGR